VNNYLEYPELYHFEEDPFIEIFSQEGKNSPIETSLVT
jgi:hypothetical protein